MMKKKLIVCSVAAILAVSANAFADQNHHKKGPFNFSPIAESAYDADWNPAQPWLIPEGFTQSVVSNESDLNIYDGGRDDWNDMNTVNETGRKAGRYLYRTHEVRGEPEGGAVSVVDLKTGEAKIIAQDMTWTAVDGIVWTPWGTVLFAEETTNGRLFELVLDKHDMMSGTVYERPAVGLLGHEGIQVGPDGSVYVVDEFRGQTSGYGGGIYKFVPDTYGDLSSGELFALKVTGDDGVGQGEWVGPIDPSNARLSGTEFGGTSYQRPEDLQVIGNTLYVAVTEGLGYAGRVLSINLWDLEVSNFVKPGMNAPVEDKANKITGFAKVDNLAATPDGKLVMIEDNVPSDIWVASKDHNHDGAAESIELFASLTDPGAEGTGIYFGKDPKTMFVNIQHSAAVDGDGTWAITKNRGHGKRHGRDDD
ncbi:MAG TPA: alkaline phosphatase PhoX [Gammaproteobacteria bacterium]